MLLLCISQYNRIEAEEGEGEADYIFVVMVVVSLSRSTCCSGGFHISWPLMLMPSWHSVGLPSRQQLPMLPLSFSVPFFSFFFGFLLPTSLSFQMELAVCTSQECTSRRVGEHSNERCKRHLFLCFSFPIPNRSIASVLQCDKLAVDLC